MLISDFDYTNTEIILQIVGHLDTYEKIPRRKMVPGDCLTVGGNEGLLTSYASKIFICSLTSFWNCTPAAKPKEKKASLSRLWAV